MEPKLQQKGPRAYWTVTELADHCGVSDDTIRRLIAAGELPAVRFLGSLRISDVAFREFLGS